MLNVPTWCQTLGNTVRNRWWTSTFSLFRTRPPARSLIRRPRDPMEKSYSTTGKTTLLQPMNQGVITAFKAYCLEETFSKLIQVTTGKEKPCLNEFWR